jgi:hypothetical protein
MVRRSQREATGTLTEAALIAATGISPRNLIRWRQQGLIPTVSPRHGLGPGGGRGTTPLEYPMIAVAQINRLNELRREFKGVEEWRWHLWCEGYSVRIGVALDRTMGRLRVLASQIKTIDDIETKILPLLKPAYTGRSNPLRVIFRDIGDEDMHSVTTMLFCVCLGIRLPLFDEPNPDPFQIFKRAAGLPKDWPLPPALFDVFPYMYEQLRNALSTASADELEGARAVCRLLSRLLDNPENSRRGAIVVAGEPLPWRPIKLVSLVWPSPIVRAVTVGLVIAGMRLFKAALGEKATAHFASIAAGMSIFLLPESPPQKQP